MRRLATAERIRALFQRWGARTREPATVYLTGGATAVLNGWRESTIDVDVKLVPDRDELLRAVPALKEELEINIELASPDLFVPVKAGWEERSPWVLTEGPITVRHFDLYAQALSKVERDHARDRADVAAMIERGLIDPTGIAEYLAAVEEQLFRYPAVDPTSLRAGVERLNR